MINRDSIIDAACGVVIAIVLALVLVVLFARGE